ncbi:hypothetical protein CBL_03410 [Carabus blaptoides fortunei]
MLGTEIEATRAPEVDINRRTLRTCTREKFWAQAPTYGRGVCTVDNLTRTKKKKLTDKKCSCWVNGREKNCGSIKWLMARKKRTMTRAAADVDESRRRPLWTEIETFDDGNKTWTPRSHMITMISTVVDGYEPNTGRLRRLADAGGG